MPLREDVKAKLRTAIADASLPFICRHFSGDGSYDKMWEAQALAVGEVVMGLLVERGVGGE